MQLCTGPQRSASGLSEIAQLIEYVLVAPLIKMSPL